MSQPTRIGVNIQDFPLYSGILGKLLTGQRRNAISLHIMSSTLKYACMIKVDIQVDLSTGKDVFVNAANGAYQSPQREDHKVTAISSTALMSRKAQW